MLKAFDRGFWLRWRKGDQAQYQFNEHSDSERKCPWGNPCETKTGWGASRRTRRFSGGYATQNIVQRTCSIQ